MPTPTDLLPSAEHALTGVDRATYNVYHEGERHLVEPIKRQHQASRADSSDSGDSQEDTNPSPRSFANVRRASEKVRSKAKAKTNRILHSSAKQYTSNEPLPAPALAPAPSPTADNDRLYNPPPEHKGPQAKDVLHHPVDTVSSLLHGASGAKMAEVMDNQTIAHGADVNLVRAHDKVASAENKEEKQSAEDGLEELKKARQDTYVRWTMDRHVLKVRRVPPLELPRPHRKDYTLGEEKGKGRVNWATYGQDLARFYARLYGDQYIDESPNLPPATEESINVSFERLLMASMPYQVVLMKIRHIYRWDNPTETAMWLVGYMLFWTINKVAGAAVLVTIWMVVRRRLYPPTLDDLREDIKRSEDVEQTATNFTQLIEQHGSRGWIDALITDLGPRSLLQLTDAADSLEIMRNFYEWRSPRQTMISLALLSLCWLYVTLTPLWFLVKLTQLWAALVFFGTFPIASRYPHYRIVVSPLTWLFWKVPTDAEWAIARLQVEARYTKRAVLPPNDAKDSGKQADPEKKSENSKHADATIKIGKYHCTSQNHHGHLILTAQSVRYVTAVRSNVLWELRYDNVKTIQKPKSHDGISFVLMDDSEHKVMGLKQRDEVFTQMIGYSGLNWQVTG